MEKRVSQLEAEVAILKAEMKLVRMLSSNKTQEVAVGKSKVGPKMGKLKCDHINDLPLEMMEIVLKKLDTTSLKNCRRVCHKRNLQATHLLANRSEINPEKIFPWHNTQQHHILIFPSKITPGLIKNIVAGDDVKLLTAFFEKYGEQVKGLKILWWSFKSEDDKLLPFLHRVFTELCLNLEDLVLFEVCHEDPKNEKFTQKQMSFEFSNRLALKSLQVCKDSDMACWSPESDFPPLSSFLKSLILASDHLEQIITEAVYCPNDLSKQIALKTLFLMNMRFSQIKQMEFGDGNNLENLTVSDACVPELIHSKRKRNKKSQQRFPALLNLTIKTGFGKVPQPSSNFAYYMLERSPVLESLTIKAYGRTVDQVKDQITDLFHDKKSGKSYPKLTALKMIVDIEDQEIFESIVNLTTFPNLTTLEFAIGKYASLTDEQRDNTVSKWFEIFSKLKLVHLTLRMQCNIKMSKLADAISGNPNLFRGLETLYMVCCYGGDCDADDLGVYPLGQMPAFQKALRLTSTLKQATFVEFEMRGSTLKNLMDFVTTNRLPVTFDYNPNDIREFLERFYL